MTDPGQEPSGQSAGDERPRRPIPLFLRGKVTAVPLQIRPSSASSEEPFLPQTNGLMSRSSESEDVVNLYPGDNNSGHGNGDGDGVSSSNTSSSSFRAQSPPVEWGPRELNQPCPKHGRVGIFQAKPPEGDRPDKKLRAMYVQVLNRQGLLEYLQATKADKDGLLFQIFHVQNARWALDILSKEFGIGKNPSGSEFLRYARHKRQDPGGKPYLTGKSWPLQTNEESGVRQMYLSFDYLKAYSVLDPLAVQVTRGADRMTELNHYDDEGNAAYGYDLAVQRLSCFFQHKSTQWISESDTPLRRFFADEGEQDSAPLSRHPHVTHDDTETAIIFEESRSRSVDDTLIPARARAEKSWLRLCKNAAHKDQELKDDAYFYPKFVRTVLDDIFNHLTRSWETVLDLASEHQSILENKIYDQPADESRTQELWNNSFQWLRIEKLMAQHRNLTKVLKGHADALTEDVKVTSNIKFLAEAPDELMRLSKTLEINLVKSTENLITLLYQSVAIRDSRHSLQLGNSMARLSWITFVFLPLTAVASFFGMNTSWIKDDPNIKWYGIMAVSLFAFVILCWFLIKFIPTRLNRTPHQRGLYESFFHSLAVQYPKLWSRAGPRSSVVPQTRMDKFKWSVIKYWSQPENTIATLPADEDGDSDIDTLLRWRRYFIRKWTKEIKVSQPGANNIEDGLPMHSVEQTGPRSTVAHPTIESVLDTTDSATNSTPRLHDREWSKRFSTSSARSSRAQITPQASPSVFSNLKPRRSQGDANARSALDAATGTIVVSEEERADHIVKCGKNGRPWGWSGNRKTGSSKEGEWSIRRPGSQGKLQKAPMAPSITYQKISRRNSQRRRSTGGYRLSSLAAAATAAVSSSDKSNQSSPAIPSSHPRAPCPSPAIAPTIPAEEVPAFGTYLAELSTVTIKSEPRSRGITPTIGLGLNLVHQENEAASSSSPPYLSVPPDQNQEYPDTAGEADDEGDDPDVDPDADPDEAEHDSNIL